ncbi:MAG: hypothetical protein V4450_17510 [Bacteroidota bacterium]
MNKSKKKVNPFDVLIEKFVAEFQKVPNFDLLQKENSGRKMFNLLMFRLADLSSYKDLVINYYIPATNKAIADSLALMAESKYKALLNYDRGELYDTLHQTIRLAYVAVFHKLESFMNEVVQFGDIIFEGDKDGETLEQFSKRVFNFWFRDWKQFLITDKINWIANCVKHHDGYPRKEPRPLLGGWYSSDSRLVLTRDEFKTDVERLIEFTNVYLQLASMISQYKMVKEGYNPSLWDDDLEAKAKQEDLLKQVYDTIQSFIDAVKN